MTRLIYTFFIFSLMLIAQYAYSDVTADAIATMVGVDVPDEVVMGGAASINWVLAVVATFSSSGFIYTILILIKELRAKAQDNREGWLLLREAREVIARNNNHSERSLEVMLRVERALGGFDDS